MSAVAVEARTRVWRALDGVAEAASDTPGVWSAWPRLLDLARGTLAEHGRDGLAVLRAHPVAAVTRECPLTNWAWLRPRGYPNDARLADFLYGHECVAESLDGATERGRAIAGWNGGTGLAEAIRERRRILAALVDEAVEREGEGGAEVLALAAQHLREATLARHAGSVARWVALDRDPESVDEIAEDHAGRVPGLEAIPCSLERTVLQPREHGTFHLAYAANACEYLHDPAAGRLARAMFEALRPGGRMLLASLVPGIPESGYMAAYMDWRPVARDEAGLRGLLSAIPAAACARRETFTGANGRVAYALVERAPEATAVPRRRPRRAGCRVAYGSSPPPAALNANARA